MLGLGLGLTLGAQGRSGPSIARTASSFPEDTASGTTVATLSVVNHPSGSSGWSFALTADPDSKFNATITAGALKTAAAVDYETKTSHSVTITASKTSQTDIVQTLVFQVSNVFEAANLSALSFSGTLTQNASSPITIGNKTSGSTLSLLSGALPDGMTLGASSITGTPTTLGTGSATIRETLADSANSPRDSVWSWEVVAVPAGAAPTVTKWALEGTSLQLETTPGPYALGTAMTELGQTYINYAAGGSKTTNPSDPPKDMTARLTANASALATCDGAVFGTGAPNDLTDFASDAAALSAYTTYAASLKAAVNNGPVGILGIPPQDESRTGKTGFNSRRHYVNAGLRAFCLANTGYFYIPAGEHPDTAYDNAAALTASGGTGAYESDGLHPGVVTATVTNEKNAIKAALDAFVNHAGEAPATNPSAFTITDATDVATDTDISSVFMVQGLGYRQSAAASVSAGSATIDRGYGYDYTGVTSGFSVMAGDTIKVTLHSSVANDTEVHSTVAVGSQSDVFNVTTASASGLVASDDFNRADGSPGSTPVGSKPWVGGGVISSNQLYIDGSTNTTMACDPGLADFDITVTVGRPSGSAFGSVPQIIFWGERTGTSGGVGDYAKYYHFNIAAAALYLHYAGSDYLMTDTGLGADGADITVGMHTIRIVGKQTTRTVDVYVDGSLHTQGTYPSGNAAWAPTGTYFGVWDVNPCYFEDFSASVAT